MNYLRYSSIILILLFVSLILISSSSATDLSVEDVNLDSNLNIIYQNDSINTKSNLIDLNSFNNPNLDESIKSDGNSYSGLNKVSSISGNTFKDIQNAINNAKNGDSIILNNISY